MFQQMKEFHPPLRKMGILESKDDQHSLHLEISPPAMLGEMRDSSPASAIQEGRGIKPLLAFEAVKLRNQLFF